MRFYRAQSPFSHTDDWCDFEPGTSVVEACGTDQVRAWADGVEIPAELLDRPLTTAKAVRIVPVPASNSAKGILGSLMTIVGTILLYTPFFWVGVGLIAAGTILQMTIRPKKPDNTEYTTLKSLTSAQNQIAQFQPIPRVYGRMGYFPPIPVTARPYTQLVGNDQYLIMKLCLGYGPLDVGGVVVGSDTTKITQATSLASVNGQYPITIGDTPITEFDGVTFQIGRPTDTTIYTSEVDEQQIAWTTKSDTSGISSDAGGQTVTDNLTATRTTAPGCTGFSIDLTGNIYSTNSKGQYQTLTINWQLQWRVTGTSTWSSRSFTMSTSSPQTLRISQAVTGLANTGTQTYDVKLNRVSTNIPDFEGLNTEVAWTALRSSRDRKAFGVAGTVVMDLKIKATDQLQGALNNVRVIATSVLPVYDGTSWSDQATRNPAWVSADILCGSANRRPLAHSSLNLDAYLSWASEASTSGRHYDDVMDSDQTTLQRLAAVHAQGRAGWTVDQDATFRPVLDSAETDPRMVITPRNSVNYGYQLNAYDPPHALRVQYVSNQTWQPTERIVYDDGYTEANATLFETVQCVGCTDDDIAWKNGRYNLALKRLRDIESHTLNQPLGFLHYGKGDVVALSQDVILVGLGYGRITSVITNASHQVTKIGLDAPVTMESGKTYGVTVMCADAESFTAPVNTSVGTVDSLTFTTPVDSYTDGSPRVIVGDLFAFGEAGKETTTVKVAQIEPADDLTARVTFVPAAFDALDAETGTIPAPPDDISARAFDALPSFDVGVTLDPRIAALMDALSDIASDNVLSSAEKPTVMRDYSVITTEQAGIDAQATQYGITTAKSDYDSAVTALTAYLGTLTSPTAWNDKSGNTTIDGPTFRANFNTVYTRRQTLLNAIYAAAKAKADAAQSTANQALGNTPYLQNPYFTTGDLTGWTSDYGGWVFESGTNGPATGSTSYAKRTGSSTHPSEAIRNSGKIPVYPGARIKAQCAVKGYNSPNGTCGVRISWRDASDTELSTTAGNTTTGNATNGTYVTGTAPAGAMYAHVECAATNHTTGTYSLDNFAAWALADSMDQVPDSGTRFAAAQAGADKTSSNPQAKAWLSDASTIVSGGDNITRLSGRTLDNIADSTTYRRVGSGYVDSSNRVTTLWDGTTVRAASFLSDGATRATTGLDSAGALVQDKSPLTRLSGRTLGNIADDATYIRTIQQSQSETVDNANFEASTALPVPGWIGTSASLNYATAGNAFTGNQSLLVAITATFGAAASTRKYPCTAGNKFLISAAIGNFVNTGPAYAFLSFIDKTGTFIGSDGPSSSTNSWGVYSKTVVAPAGAVAFIINLQNFGAPGSQAGYDQILLSRVRSIDLEIADGTTYGRTANADLFTSGGVNRIGLRVPGSGHIFGDQRNAPSSLTRNLGMVRSATALTAHAGGAVDVNAHTVTMGSAVVSYSAKSNAVTGLTTGNSYYIYTRDNYAGGSPTFAATASSTTVNGFDDAYNAGVVTIPASGTSGGGGTWGPGTACVCADMWLRAGLTARDLAKRWRWWKPQLWFLQGQDGWHLVRRRPRIVPAPSCRVTVADGSTIDCSNYTPVTTQTGESVLAPMLHGHLVATDNGWQRVLNVQLLPGNLDVVRISVGGHSFFAGQNPYRRISTHNTYKP